MTDGAPSAPPGKQVVLVRAGPSKKRPLIVDGVFGVLGAFLLIASVVLVNVLPEEDVVDPQYKVSFGPVASETLNSGPEPTRFIYILPGQTLELAFNVSHPNLSLISVTVGAEDDHPATFPDEAQLELVAPNGTVYPFNAGSIFTAPVVRIEPEDEGDPVPQQPGFFYQTDPNAITTRLANFPIQAQPRDFFVTADPDAELFEVRDEIRGQFNFVDSIGTWLVRVSLVDPGHCPPLEPTSPLFQRAIECREQTPRDPQPTPAHPDYVQPEPSEPDQDPGNQYAINFSYTVYQVAVERA